MDKQATRGSTAGIVEGLLLAGILALAAYLRLHNLTGNPGWYADEATHVNIAANLLQGEWRYLAVDESVLVFARMPLFEGLLAAFSGVFGVGMLTLRTLTALLGLLCVGLLYGIVRGLDRPLALTAAFVLAVYPDAILYSRLGYSYALSAPLLLIAVLGLSRYWPDGSRRWLLLTVGAAGFGLLADVMMGTVIVALLLVVFLRRWHDLLWALPLAFVPLAGYVLISLVTNGAAFRLDAAYTISRLNTMTMSDQWFNLVQNYTVLLNDGFWFSLGIVGALLLRPARLAFVVMVLLLVPFFLMARTVALFQLSFYYLIPLLPLIALGVAGALVGAIRAVWQPEQSWMQRGVILILLALMVGVPFFHELGQTWDAVHEGYATDIDPFLVDGTDAQAVAAYINGRTNADDVVIASPAIAWMIDANAADPQMSIAYNGVETVHLPEAMPRDRFAFNPRFERARYVVVDNIWRNWTIHHVPGVAGYWQTIEQSWAVVFRQGDLVVYENPTP